MSCLPTTWKSLCLSLPPKVGAPVASLYLCILSTGSFVSPASESSRGTNSSQIHFSGLYDSSDHPARTPLLATDLLPLLDSPAC